MTVRGGESGRGRLVIAVLAIACSGRTEEPASAPAPPPPPSVPVLAAAPEPTLRVAGWVDGGPVAFVATVSTVMFWDPASGHVLDVVPTDDGSEAPPDVIAVPVRGGPAFVEAGEGWPSVLVSATGLAIGALRVTFEPYTATHERVDVRSLGRSERIDDVVFAGSLDRWARLRDGQLTLGSAAGRVDVAVAGARSFVFSPDGLRIALPSRFELELRDATTGALARRIEGDASSGATFSDDGAVVFALASETSDGGVHPRAFDAETGAEIVLPFPACTSAVHMQRRGGPVLAFGCGEEQASILHDGRVTGRLRIPRDATARVRGERVAIGGEPGGVFGLDGTELAPGPLHVLEVADDGRRLGLGEDGEVRVLGLDGATLATLEAPHVGGDFSCPGGDTLAALVAAPGAECPARSPRERTPPAGVDVVLAPTSEGGGVGRAGEEVVVWQADGTEVGRFGADALGASCLEGPGRCRVTLVAGGTLLLVESFAELRALDPHTGERLGRRATPTHVHLVVAPSGAHAVVSEPGGFEARELVALPSFRTVRAFEAGRTATYHGEWLLESGGGRPSTLTSALATDGSPSIELEGAPFVEIVGDRLYLPSGRHVEVRSLRGEGAPFTVPGVLRCAREDEVFTCDGALAGTSSGGHLVHATWAEDGTPHVETTTLPCPRDCDVLVDDRALVTGPPGGGAWGTLVRRSDGATLDVVAVTVGARVVAVARDADGFFSDHADLVWLRRPSLTADGMIPAPTTGPTMGSWLAGP